MTTSAEMMLSRLLERLLTAAEASWRPVTSSRRAPPKRCARSTPTTSAPPLILERPQHSRPGRGQQALVTLLFSDLVGSTLLSERVEPEQLRDLFSSYRGASRRRDPVRRQPRPVLR